MKICKLTAILLALICVFPVLASCGNTDDGNKDTEVPSVSFDTTKADDTTKTPDTTADETTKVPDTTEAATETVPAEDGKVHVSSITLDKYEVSLNVGGTDMPWVTMKPDNAADKGEIWSSSDTSVATVNDYGKITGVKEGSCTVTVKSKDNPTVKAEVKVTVKKGENQTAATEATYIEGILIVNKTYALPANFAGGVDATAQTALNNMFAAAAADGINLWVASSFRSYDRQATLYNNYVARDGKEEADRYSARPGHSEHETGLAFDLNSLDQSFGQTPEGQWLKANCYKYGFIIRYPEGKESVTGYMYEPWHVRYLGVDVATKVYNSGKTLEEYLGITSKYAN